MQHKQASRHFLMPLNFDFSVTGIEMLHRSVFRERGCEYVGAKFGGRYPPGRGKVPVSLVRGGAYVCSGISCYVWNKKMHF